MLSPKRQQIISFISRFIESKGYAPSIREIANGCNINSPSMTQYHLNILEHDGYIHRDRSVPRSISLVKEEQITVAVPLLGTIAAGEPIPVPASESWNAIPYETIAVPSTLAEGLNNIFALNVKGTSMIDALIDDGDIILLQQAETADDGEMVAVWLISESETTLKRIYRDSRKIRLQPANRQMKPFYYDPHDVRIQGRVVGVIRKPQKMIKS
jgi:repressor LexA